MRGVLPILKSLSLAGFLVVLGFAFRPQESASDDTMQENCVDARVGRIVKNLLPAAVIKGQQVPRMTLAERMKYYNTPEVSIAVFKDGRVDWARGHGLADKTINKPVTPDTLFQAASISKSLTAFAALRLVQ